MILITGATGNLGSNVVKQLSKSLESSQYIVTSSNQAGVEKLSSQGLNARLAQFNDPQTLDEAFKGVSKILLISTMENNRFEQHKNVIDAAKQNGVSHIVYTSLAIQNIEASAVKDLMISHFETEDYLIKSGLKYTILRNTMYADALPQILGPNGLNQDINLPGGDGRVPYALRSEMGEATANLLLQDHHENVIYDIVGSQSYSYAELVDEINELTQGNINYNNITAEAFAENLKKIGFPDFAIYLHGGTIADIKNHQYEIPSDTLEKLLGRPTANAQTFLQEVFNIN